jgi:hypothetical protein
MPAGHCPACDSANIINLQKSDDKKNSKRRPYRLLFCIGLWLYLAVAIYQKLNS